MFEKIIEQLTIKTKEDNLKLKDILNILYSNKELQDKYTNDIRRSTIIWQIANEVLSKLKIKENCKILAIWDIKYFWKHEKNWKKLVKKSLNSIDPSKLIWYDISSQWSIQLRNTLFWYMNNYYDLSNLENDKIIDSIIPTYWWIDWLVSLLDTIKNKYKKIKFIYPEASFIWSSKIAESILWKNNTIKVNKPKKHNFFFSEEQIDEIYKKNTNFNNTNIYYITPVWNPTWSKIKDSEFIKIIKKIISLDNNAIVILDNVYVWLLEKNISIKMFTKIFKTKLILDKIIFAESLSKSLGTTWLRIGWLWTTNEILSSELKKNIILKKAWFSKILNEFAINLLSNNKKITNFQKNIHNFCSEQRKKFSIFIKDNYKWLFNFSSSCNFSDNEWMYLLLKVREWLTKEDIFSQTWIIWVWIELSDWLYIRYAFWNINYY